MIPYRLFKDIVRERERQSEREGACNGLLDNDNDDDDDDDKDSRE